jgi:hypothetical protein
VSFQLHIFDWFLLSMQMIEGRGGSEQIFLLEQSKKSVTPKKHSSFSGHQLPKQPKSFRKKPANILSSQTS